MKTTKSMQRFEEQKAHVEIVKLPSGPSGDRFARVFYDNGNIDTVPVDLLPLMAGPDAWMKDIEVRCTGCGQKCKARDMENGIYCQACFEQSSEENARLDNGG